MCVFLHNGGDRVCSLLKVEDARKMKKDITEAGKAMGAYSIGGRAKKLFGGRIKKKKPETKEQKSIKEKILPKKKKDRLEELRKQLQ